MGLIQIIPLVMLLVGALGVFFMQRADVEQLKSLVAKQEAALAALSDQYVSKTVFEMKLQESERQQAQLNKRLDKIEDLITGLYDRLPSKK